MFNLIPYSKNENSIFNIFDRFEREFWNNAISDQQQFRTDIIDSGDKYVLTADLPGFNKEDIHIVVENNLLTISAKKDDVKEESNSNYVRRERRYGAFSRSFDLTGINADNIVANHENGVLTLNLPKNEPQQLPPSRQIEIQ